MINGQNNRYNIRLLKQSIAAALLSLNKNLDVLATLERLELNGGANT